MKKKSKSAIIHISLGGPMKSIRIGKTKIYYEDHSYLGPCPCTMDGEPRNLKATHPFWKAITEHYKLTKAPHE